MVGSPSNRLLVEAGFGGTYFGFGNFERNPNPTRDLIRVVEQCASGCAANGNIPGLAYRSQDFSDAYNGSYLWKGVGVVCDRVTQPEGWLSAHVDDAGRSIWMTNNQNLTYRFDNGVPNQLTRSISPWVNHSRTGWDAVFAQERWTRGRLTVQGAVRFDRAAQLVSRAAGRPVQVPAGAHHHSGNAGRGQLQGHHAQAGRVLRCVRQRQDGAQDTPWPIPGRRGHMAGIYTSTNPTLRMPQTTSDARHGRCDASLDRCERQLRARLRPAEPERAGPPGERRRPVRRGVEHELRTERADQQLRSRRPQRLGRPAVGLDARRVDSASDSPARIGDAHVQPSLVPWLHRCRQPGAAAVRSDAVQRGGAAWILACRAAAATWCPGLYDVAPDKAGQVSNLIADSSKYGRWYQYFNGLDATLNLRAGGFTFIGGTSTGQTVADNCDVRAHLPELATTTAGTSPLGAGLASSIVSPVSPYCHVAFGIQTQFRGLASYDCRGSALSCPQHSKASPGRCWRPTTPCRTPSWRRRSDGTCPGTRRTSR